MKQYIYLAITGILLSFLSSCTAIDPDGAETANERVQISTRVSAYSGLEAPGDNKYDDLTAYFFVDNIFAEKRVVTGDTLSASISKKKNSEVYFVANSSSFKELATLKVGSSDVSVLLSAKIAASTSGSGAKMFMSSHVKLDPTQTKQTTDLIRGVARLDVTISDPGISISAVRVNNTASEAVLWPNSESMSATTSYAKKFETPVSKALPALFYLYEHSNIANCTVEVDLTLKGQAMTAHATLPKNLIRNTVYEVSVKGVASDKVEVELKIREWGVGSVVDATPDSGAAILLDPATTQLPDTVVADYKSSIITVPGAGSHFTFGLKSDFAVEITPEGTAPSSIRITPVAGEKNRFQVTVDPQPWNADAYNVRYALKNTLLENAYDYLTIQVKDRPFDIPTVTLGGVEWMAFNTLGKDGLIQTRVSAGQSIEEVYQTRFADAMGYYVHWGRPVAFKPWENTAPQTGGGDMWQKNIPCPPRFRVPSVNDYKKIFPVGTAIPSTYTVNGKQFEVSSVDPTTQVTLPSSSKINGRYLVIEEKSTGHKLFLPFAGYKGDKQGGTGRDMGGSAWLWVIETAASGGWAQAFQVTGGSTPKAAYASLQMDGFATLRCVKQ